ncbi:MAG: GNAT family N-acetyltransferase [Pseudomonadota bacterium]
MPRPATAPVLTTERLVLRGHRVEDFEESAALWADPVVVHYISGRPSSAEETWSRLLRYVGHWHLLGFGYWVATDRQTGAFIGEVGFADYKRDITPDLAGRPEAGWVLRTSAHGRGLATEAVRAMLEWADAVLKAPASVAIFNPEHSASIRVAEKVGYSAIGMATYRERPTLVMERARASG